MFRASLLLLIAASLSVSAPLAAQPPTQATGDPNAQPPDGAQPARPRVPKPAPKVGADIAAELPESVYRARRERLIARLGACAALLPSGPSKPAADAFFYLTGSRQPGAALLLSPRQVFKQVLFVPASTEDGKRDGKPLDVHGRALLRTDLALDQVQTTGTESEAAIARALRQSRCYAALQPSLHKNPALPRARLRELLEATNGHVQQRWQVLEHMRANKDEREMALIEKAAALVIHGHRTGIKQARGNRDERYLSTVMNRAMDAAGGQGSARSRVVSGQRAAQLTGENGTTAPQPGELVVLEATVSYGGYAARAVRTFPVSGAFSDVQAPVYDAVLAAHKQAIATIRSGVPLARVQRVARTALEEAGYRAQRNGSRGTPYADTHFIGLALRDVGNPDAPLDAGMVVVVETGVLITGSMAVRLADMVQVEPRGRRLLTADIPLDRSKLAAWMKKP